MRHPPTTHMFPVGFELHPNEQSEARNLRRSGRASDLDRSLADRLRAPYLEPEKHLAPERDRLPYRLDRV